MSSYLRNLLTILLLLLLAGSAFVAGYFANDFVELRMGGTLVRERQEFDLFWEAWQRVEDNYLGTLPSAQAFTYGAIRGVLTVLDDPYTIFVEPVVRDQERDTLRGTFGGIGAYLRRPEEGGEVVLEPIPGNPAEAAGILLNDVLLAVGETLITPEMTMSAVAELVRGEVGTEVTLTVRHPGETESVEIVVVRGEILIPSVTYRLLETETPIGYIQLTRFSGESGNEIRQAITDLQAQGATHLILDLRQNGGGLLDAAVEVADHFLDEGVVVYQQSRDAGEVERRTTDETIAGEMPLVVLVDGGTASASEILAGALQDRDRAMLIGQRTYGKGSVQLVFDLSDGSSVHVTSARWFTPNRQPLDQHGLEPEMVVEMTQADIDNGRDPFLERAIVFLERGE